MNVTRAIRTCGLINDIFDGSDTFDGVGNAAFALAALSLFDCLLLARSVISESGDRTTRGRGFHAILN